MDKNNKLAKLFESGNMKLSELFGNFEMVNLQKCWDTNSNSMDGYTSCAKSVLDRLSSERDLLESKLVFVSFKMSKCLETGNEDSCYNQTQDLFNHLYDGTARDLK